MARLDELLSTDDEAPTKRSLDDLLTVDEPTRGAERPRRSREDLQAILDADEGADVPWYKRALVGAADPIVGAGQLIQNIVPDETMNFARKTGQSLLDAVGADEAGARMASPTTDADFNAGLRRMEQRYQSERANAGQEGLDVARIGGAIANPVTWFGPTKGGPGLWNTVRTGAKQGAFQALLQPVTDTGNFLYSKGMQVLTGATLGGILGATMEALASPLAFVVKGVRNIGGGAAEKVAAASQETDDVLRAAGVDPMKMDPRLYQSIQREVAEAIDAGVNPDPRVITNRADAAALPIPMQITRGQATRDPMQFSWEQNNAKLRGVGEPLTQMLAGQNRQLIENLNELGARNALSPFDTSKAVISKIEEIDNAARARIKEAYDAVRDSAGRPARVSNDDFVARSKNLLTDGRPELSDMVSLADYLPDTVAKTYNDILSGKLPLTVDTVQFLDRAWGGVQRGTQDDTTKAAIGHLRTALNEAKVSDSLGDEAMTAYKAARQMARRRFGAIEANPAYKAVDDGVEPDRFFQKYVSGANASEIRNLMQLVGPDLTKRLQQTTVANLKSTALSRASDENGVFSQAAYNKVLQDPVTAPRLAALFESDPQTLSQLYRVGRVAENVVAFPKMHSVNTSNTTPTAANLARDIVKDRAEGIFSNMHPIIGGLRKLGTDYKDAKAASAAVDQAINPGVTATPVLKQKPTSGRLSDLAARAGGGYAASDREE